MFSDFRIAAVGQADTRADKQTRHVKTICSARQVYKKALKSVGTSVFDEKLAAE